MASISSIGVPRTTFRRKVEFNMSLTRLGFAGKGAGIGRLCHEMAIERRALHDGCMWSLCQRPAK
jgi:hypothetical protein